MFGARGRGGISVYHLLVETCLGGNLFIGCVEPHFDVFFGMVPSPSPWTVDTRTCMLGADTRTSEQQEVFDPSASRRGLESKT